MNIYSNLVNKEFEVQQQKLEEVKSDFEPIAPKSETHSSLKERISSLGSKLTESLSNKKPTEIDKKSIKLQKSYQNDIEKLNKERKYLNHNVKRISEKFDKITDEMNIIKEKGDLVKNSKESNKLTSRIKQTGKKIDRVGSDVETQAEKLDAIAEKVESIESKKVKLDQAVQKRKELVKEISNSLEDVDKSIRLNESAVRRSSADLKEPLNLKTYHLLAQQKKLKGLEWALKNEEFTLDKSHYGESWLISNVVEEIKVSKQEVKELIADSNKLRSLRPEVSSVSPEKKTSFISLKLFSKGKKQENYSEDTVDNLNKKLFAFAMSVLNVSPETGKIYGELEKEIGDLRKNENVATQPDFIELQKNFNKLSTFNNIETAAQDFVDLHSRRTELGLEQPEVKPRVRPEAKYKDHPIGDEINALKDNIASSIEELTAFNKPFNALAGYFLGALNENLEELENFENKSYKGIKSAIDTIAELTQQGVSKADLQIFGNPVTEYKRTLNVSHQTKFDELKKDVDALNAHIKNREKLIENIDSTITRLESAKKKIPQKQQKMETLNRLKTEVQNQTIDFNPKWRDQEIDFQRKITLQLDPIRNERLVEAIRPGTHSLTHGKVHIDSKGAKTAVFDKNAEISTANRYQFMKEALNHFKDQGVAFPHTRTREYVVFLNEKGEVEKTLTKNLSAGLKNELKNGTFIPFSWEDSKAKW